jgi:hypothetical protein
MIYQYAVRLRIENDTIIIKKIYSNKYQQILINMSNKKIINYL